MYREEILEHYKNPQNFGKLKKYTASSRQLNPFCGDEIEIFIHKHGDSIVNIGFTGQGCAISIAGASLLTQYIKRKSVKELTTFSDENMLSLLDIEISETRKKCALLSLRVLKECIG